MSGKDWDELDLANERPSSSASSASAASAAPASSSSSSSSGAKRGGRALRLGWLVALLFAAVGAALAGLALDGRLQERTLLARARDEAAVQRRRRFVAEDQLLAIEKARAAERTRAALLASRLAPTVDKKDGQVAAGGNRVTVSLADEGLFGKGEAELSAHGQETLAKLGAVLKEVSDQQLTVGGYSDETVRSERFPSNWELSATRATSVVRYLVETAGVDPHHASAAGFAEFHPREASTGKYHRLEIVLTPMPAKR